MNDVTVEPSPERVERRSILVDASPAEVFELLARPARHREFDGSDTVREATEGTPERLSLGAKFGMKMKLIVPYRMTNEVIEFVENEVIAWTHVGGHVWRYTLEPIDGGTRITEEFDWRPSWMSPVLRAMKMPARNAESIDKTLPRLANAVAPPS